jgi:hypothetical protein
LGVPLRDVERDEKHRSDGQKQKETKMITTMIKNDAQNDQNDHSGENHESFGIELSQSKIRSERRLGLGSIATKTPPLGPF